MGVKQMMEPALVMLQRIVDAHGCRGMVELRERLVVLLQLLQCVRQSSDGESSHGADVSQPFTHLPLAPVLLRFAFVTSDPMGWLASVRVRVSIRLGVVAQAERLASFSELAPKVAFGVFPENSRTFHQSINA